MRAIVGNPDLGQAGGTHGSVLVKNVVQSGCPIQIASGRPILQLVTHVKGHVVLQVLPNTWEVVHLGNSHLFQLFLWTDSGEQQDLGRIYGSCGQNYFFSHSDAVCRIFVDELDHVGALFPVGVYKEDF